MSGGTMEYWDPLGYLKRKYDPERPSLQVSWVCYDRANNMFLVQVKVLTSEGTYEVIHEFRGKAVSGEQMKRVMEEAREKLALYKQETLKKV